MKHFFLSLIIAFALSGCATTLNNFEKSEISGTKNNKIALALINNESNLGTANEPIGSFVEKDAALKNLISKECPISQPRIVKMPPAAIPIAAALGKLAFDSYLDSQIKAAESLKKSALSTYSERVIIENGGMAGYSCAIFARYNITNNIKSPGLIALIKINHVSDSSFTISPRYIKAYNAAAVTKKAAASSQSEIGVSIAISTKSIGRQQSGVKGLFATGEGVFSIPKITIGDAAKPFVCPDLTDPSQSNKSCPASDLVVYDSANGPISLTIAATEAGSIGVDIDSDIAEYKAIKEAIGPAIKDSLKEYLK
jgi:hypothetical protein